MLGFLEIEKHTVFRKVKKKRISAVKTKTSFIIVKELCAEFQIFYNNYFAFCNISTTTLTRDIFYFWWILIF